MLAKKLDDIISETWMYGITSSHVKRNMKFPGKNSSAQFVYITAVKWKRAAA